MAAEAATAPARRRPLRRMLLLLAKLLLVLALVYGVAVACGMPASVPFDVVVNAVSFPADPALQAPADGKVRLVVLQHGLWRSPWALWKLERALAAHGYEVLNPGYPSTSGSVQQHGERLAQAIAARLQRGKVDELAFVAHSLGGLVVADYLRRADAVPPQKCVLIASPMRGAMLAELRRHWWLFQLVMGDQAACQLCPGDPLHQLPLPLPPLTGTIVGDKGDANRDIPGHDDGTVAVGEAHVQGECDSVTLPLGHTAIAFDDRSIRQVLVFLRDGSFARP